MNWDQEPPKETEIKRVAKPSAKPASISWDQEPPTTEEIQQSEPRGLLQKTLEDVVAPVGRFVDKYTGAPTRAALSAGMEGKSPITGFIRQFGQDPEQAPTGKEIAQKIGFPETKLSEVAPFLYSETGEGLPLKKGGFFDPTASGAAGLGVDIAADWTNLVPGALAIKQAAKAGKTTAKIGAKAAGETAKLGAKALDIATGTRIGEKTVSGAQATAETIGKAATSTKKIIDDTLNPKVSTAYKNWVDIAQKNKIDPNLLSTSLEFGPNSTISRLERSLREGATGEKLWQDYEKGYNAISDAVQNRVINIANGIPKSEIEAGSSILEGVKKAQNELLSKMDMTYAKAGEYAPGLSLNKESRAALASKLNGVEKFAIGRIKRGIDNVDKEQGRQLLRAVDAIRQTNFNYKQSVEALQMIGRKAFDQKTILGQVPPDLEKLRDIYFKLSDAILDTVKKDINPEFADEIAKNNKIMSEFFGNRSALKPTIEQSKSPEALFRSMIASGDSKRIGALKKILPQKEFNNLKGTFINSLIKTDKDGYMSFNQIANALRQRKNVASVLFDPKEMKELTELISLGQNYGPAVLSFSGTGASSSFREFGRQLLRGFTDEKALEHLKQKARNAATKAKDAEKGLLKVTELPSESLKASPGLLQSLKRGPIERRLKGAQSITPSLYPREFEDEK